MIVVDTSVLLKCFVEEEYSEAALLLLDKHQKGLKNIQVPALFFYEFTNILAVKYQIPLNLLKESLKALFSLSLKVYHLSMADFLLAAELAKKYQLSVYDSSYLALAIKLNCPLITVDKKFHQKTHTLKRVSLLSQYLFREDL